MLFLQLKCNENVIYFVSTIKCDEHFYFFVDLSKLLGSPQEELSNLLNQITAVSCIVVNVEYKDYMSNIEVLVFQYDNTVSIKTI